MAKSKPVAEIEETDFPFTEESAPEEQPKPAAAAEPPYRAELDEKASFEDRAVAFLKSRPTQGFVSLNPFLKSLYAAPKFGERPEWERQDVAKSLRGKIAAAVESGKISVSNESYKQLGRNYYPDGVIETHYHNLATVNIEAKAS